MLLFYNPLRLTIHSMDIHILADYLQADYSEHSSQFDLNENDHMEYPDVDELS